MAAPLDPPAALDAAVVAVRLCESGARGCGHWGLAEKRKRARNECPSHAVVVRWRSEPSLFIQGGGGDLHSKHKVRKMQDKMN